MEKDKSWKKADYPNVKPAWKKIKLGKDPLEDWTKVRGFVDTEMKAKMVAKGLRAGGKKTKIVKAGSFYEIYYKNSCREANNISITQK